MTFRILSGIALFFALFAAVPGVIATQAQPAVTTYRVNLPFVAAPGWASGRPAPNPMTIAVTPDISLAQSAEIGPQGGSLAAYNTNGATFVLDIPPGALAETEMLTLIPANTANLPFAAGDRASVLVEPAGLTLLLPATLTISPPDGGDMPYDAYSFEPDGTDMHLTLAGDGSIANLAATPGTVTLQLQALRGYGATNATAVELSAQAGRGPTRFADWLEQEAARGGGKQIELSADILNQYFQAELRYSDDLARVERALGDYVRINRLIVKYADEDMIIHLIENGDPAFQILVEQAVAAAHQICVVQSRPSEGARIARIIAYLRKVRPHDPIAAFQDRLRRCLTFELKFTSTLIDQSIDFHRSVTAEATILLQAGGTTSLMTGNGVSAITNTIWEGARPCDTFTIEKMTSIFWASKGQLGLRLKTGRNGVGIAELMYSPGVDLKARYTYSCSTPNGTAVIPVDIAWAAYYDLMHLQDRVTIDQLNYRMRSEGVDIDHFTGWAYHDSQTLPELTITEDTQFELVHKPQP